MSEQEPEPVAFGIVILLAALAGAVDACGYSVLKDLYVSFMSGNTTSLGAALAHGDWDRARLIGAILGMFVAGAAAGQALSIVTGRWHQPAVTGFVAAVLAVPLACPGWAVLAFTFAMGALNAAMQHAGGVSVSLTYVTGTVVKFGQGIGRALCGQFGTGFLKQAAPWLGLLAGAAGATALLVTYGRVVFAGLPVLAAAVALAAWVALQRQAGQEREGMVHRT